MCKLCKCSTWNTSQVFRKVRVGAAESIAVMFHVEHSKRPAQTGSVSWMLEVQAHAEPIVPRGTLWKTPQDPVGLRLEVEVFHMEHSMSPAQASEGYLMFHVQHFDWSYTKQGGNSSRSTWNTVKKMGRDRDWGRRRSVPRGTLRLRGRSRLPGCGSRTGERGTEGSSGNLG